MAEDLRDSYDTISPDYLRKKATPWIDFRKFLDTLSWEKVDTVIDIGGGNGRNLIPLDADYHILVDLSIELLRGYCGPPDGARVVGVLPSLPFRKNAATNGICLAVLHHFRDRDQAVEALCDIKRVTMERTILSVWRRWRKGYREKIIERIHAGNNISDLINHERPWKSSTGDIIATRFYHYYTFKELFHELAEAGYRINSCEYLGGKYKDANIFVEVE